MREFINTALSNKVIFLNAGCLLLTGSAVASVAPYQSIIALETLQMSPARYSAFLLSVSIISLIFSMTLGAISDRLQSRKSIMLVAATCGLLGQSAMVVDFTVTTFILVHAVLLPIAATLFQQLFAAIREFTASLPKKDAEAVTSASRTLIAGAYVLVPPLIGLVVVWGLTFRWLYAFGALFYAISIILVLQLPDISTVRPRAETSGPAGTKPSSMVKAIALPIAVMSLLEGARRLNSIIFPLIVISQAGGTAADVGFIAGMIALLEIPFMMMWSAQLRKYRKGNIIGAAAIIYSVYLFAQSQISDMIGVYMLIPLNVVGVSALMSINIALLQDLIPHRLGLSTSLISITGFVGWAIASGSFGAGALLIGYSGLSALAGIFAVSGGVSLFVLQRGTSQPEQSAVKVR